MEAETDRYKGQLLDRELSFAHARFEGDPDNYLKLCCQVAIISIVFINKINP